MGWWRAATLWTLLGAASCRHPVPTQHPAGNERESLAARYVIEEPLLSPERLEVVGRTLRERIPNLRTRTCSFTPVGTRVLRTIIVPREQRALFEREARRVGIRAVPDGLARGTTDPNDPMYPGQWALHNAGGFDVGSVTAVAGMDIGAPCGWQFLVDHPAATLPRYALVIDTSIARVPDLDGVFGPVTGVAGGGPHGVDLISDDVEPLVAADNPDAGSGGDFLARSHGTMTAGIIAARTNNTEGIAGAVGPDGTPLLRLVAARALRATSDVEVAGDSSDIICALHYGAVLARSLRENGQGRLVAVNLSLVDVAAGANPSLRARYNDAFAALAAEQVLVVAATGNSDNAETGECNNGPQFPSTSSAPNVLAVSGANADGHPLFCRDVAIAPVAAPATLVDAPTVAPSGTIATRGCRGTSCAAPLATAVALMVATARPAITAADLRQLLISSAVPVPAFLGVPSARIVNVCNALNAPQIPPITRPPPVWERPPRVPPVERPGGPALPDVIPPRNPEPPPQIDRPR